MSRKRNTTSNSKKSGPDIHLLDKKGASYRFRKPSELVDIVVNTPLHESHAFNGSGVFLATREWVKTCSKKPRFFDELCRLVEFFGSDEFAKGLRQNERDAFLYHLLLTPHFWTVLCDNDTLNTQFKNTLVWLHWVLLVRPSSPENAAIIKKDEQFRSWADDFLPLCQAHSKHVKELTMCVFPERFREDEKQPDPTKGGSVGNTRKKKSSALCNGSGGGGDEEDSLEAMLDMPGGRHDNDFFDFTEIAIQPTREEIMSNKLPYIPDNIEHIVKNEEKISESEILSSYLDAEFRLLREDEIQPIREEVLRILNREDPSNGVQKRSKTAPIRVHRVGEVNVGKNMVTSVKLSIENIFANKVRKDMRRKWEKERAKKQKAEAAKKKDLEEKKNNQRNNKNKGRNGRSKKKKNGKEEEREEPERKEEEEERVEKEKNQPKFEVNEAQVAKSVKQMWKVRKYFRSDSTVVLFRHSKGSREGLNPHKVKYDLLCFGSVAWDDKLHTVGSDEFISVAINFSSEAISALSPLLGSGTSDLYIASVRSNLTGQDNVMRRIQRTKVVPLSDILLNSNPIEKAPETIMDRLYTHLQTLENTDERSDLQPLFKTAKPLMLDPSQKDAVIHSLSHSVSLVQGPPGTGKSYVGAFVVSFCFLSFGVLLCVILYTCFQVV